MHSHTLKKNKLEAIRYFSLLRKPLLGHFCVLLCFGLAIFQKLHLSTTLKNIKYLLSLHAVLLDLISELQINFSYFF